MSLDLLESEILIVLKPIIGRHPGYLDPCAKAVAVLVREILARGGKASAASLTREQRQDRARKAAQARWAKHRESKQ